MKKTNLLMAVIFLLLLFSCSKDASTSSFSSGQKMVKTVQVYDTSSNMVVEEWLFTYDNNERITSLVKKGWTGPIYMDINYVDPYNTIVTSYEDSNKVASKKFSLSYIKYNTKGDVIYDSTVINDSIVSITNHQYYGDSVRITRPNIILASNIIYGFDSRFRILNENYSQYTYDSNINPLYRLKPIFGYLFTPVFDPVLRWDITSKNNVLQRHPIYNSQGDLTSFEIHETIFLKFTYY